MSSEALQPVETPLQAQKELQAAGVMQRRMLPTPPTQFANFTFSYELFSASELCGDFVDYLDLPNNRVAFLVADVAGHGASAALLTVALKSFVTRIPDQPLQSPASLLTALNAELQALDLDRHVCALLGVLDSDTGALCLASAGAFPLPFLLQADASNAGNALTAARTPSCATAITVAGKALGIFDSPVYAEQQVWLSGGDRLTVVTDGVLELLSDSSLAEKEQKIAVAAGAPIDEFWATLNVEPKAFDIDDITCFTLECHQ